MSHIHVNNVTIDFPVLDASQRSLKKHIFKFATSGILKTSIQGRVTVRALNDITFSIEEGDRVGLIGNNGAGKSTLLRLIGGIYVPTSGTIEVDGHIASLIDISLGIDPELSGRDNIFIRGQLLGFHKAEIYDYLEDIIAFSELGDFIDMPLRTYSSGMLLRLAFSISTIISPQILIMDEWLAVGDASFTLKAQKRLETLIDKSNILVIASHSKTTIRRLCNKVFWLKHGEIIRTGDPHQISEEYFFREL